MPATHEVSSSAKSGKGALSSTSIRVYNTLSRAKEAFLPLRPPHVGIYLCGPTVYKPSHIGHMVGPVIFDAIKRYLNYSGYQVTLVVNITDVDDKLINEARSRGMKMSELAAEMTEDYLENLRAMGVDAVDHFPKATENMDEIISFIGLLVEKGFAYAAENGDVYFDVDRDADYGKLSRRSLESMQGEGGEMGEQKRSPVDFALWKSAKPGEPSWESPWGAGRPGWHIECSAMSRRLLGESFDIHGGGLDLIFPHHENEIAQSECCHGKPQAKYWMHNGLMQSSGEVGKVGGRNTRDLSEGDQQAQEAGKLGKSKGASPFRELLKLHEPESIRFFLLSTHYRRPIDFSEDRIREVATGLESFYRFFKRFERVTSESFYELKGIADRSAGDFDPAGNELLAEVHQIRGRFLAAMDDDFNTGGGIGSLFDLVRLLNRFVDSEKLEAGDDTEKIRLLKVGGTVLRELSATLGLFRNPLTSAVPANDELVNGLMSLLIEIRAFSRQKRDFSTADKIRDSLSALGITLQDRTDGTDWSRES